MPILEDAFGDYYGVRPGGSPTGEDTVLIDAEECEDSAIALSREMAAELGELLIRFSETGKLAEDT